MQTRVLDRSELETAAELILAGQLVAFPTETVYGLGASVFHEEAIESIFRVKGRPSDNPLIVHVHSLEQVKEVAREIPPLFYQLAEAFWPGPLTCILKRNSSVPSLVSAGLDSVAVRMPSHKTALELILRAQVPLVGPSANLSGKPSPTSVEHVLEDFKGQIAAVVDGGESEFGIESTVISLLGGKPVILRPGSITQACLEKILGYSLEVEHAVTTGAVVSPGMKYRHYAPKCPIVLVDTMAQLLEQLRAQPQKGKRGSCMVLSHSALNLKSPGIQFHLLSAKTLYSLLRRSDAEGVQVLFVLCDQQMQADEALMNRLMKAASPVV